MKGLRSIPRVLKINSVKGRSISLLFNNGQSKIIDIAQLLTDGKPVGKGSLVNKILNDDVVFSSVAIIDNTIGWPGVGKYVKDFSGESKFHPYDIDPLLLYNAGNLDENQNLNLGSKIKTIRKRIGLTQEELAKRVGTTKNYISKLENNKSDIELLTLKKIVEAGLNGKLHLSIEIPN
ncbi:helix-turn-helix domain-containing protein [Lewinella sp. 4G2]|uniref:helix-turn-helix domain-containing protein n=1 Tax=Lewinella sp. 4G2 TaxID=1803372 RepID=UPI0009EE2EE5|nr:helix-turn-helix transcriptional regulator [Lewinella sp. 4G2]